MAEQAHLPGSNFGTSSELLRILTTRHLPFLPGRSLVYICLLSPCHCAPLFDAVLAFWGPPLFTFGLLTRP